MLNSQASLNSLDIQQARIKFILFRSKVRSILYGGSQDDSTLLSPRENALGQWLYNTAFNKYNNIPEIAEIEKLNLNIIRKAQNLISMYKRGNIEEARKGLSTLDVNEEELIRLLHDIEKKYYS